MPTVSVIVPVYRVEKYLRRCMESILKQTYSDFEIIVVDDGSTDECPLICDEYAKKDKRITVIHKNNGGLSSARNAGLDIANGEYILFVDSDDYIKPNLLETCLNKIKETNCDSVRFGYEKIDEKFNITRTRRPHDFSYSFLTSEEKLNFLCNVLLSYAIPFTAWSCLFKNDIIKKHHLRFVSERIIYSEDTFFSSLYTFHSSTCVAIDESLYVYQDNKYSLMGNYKSQKVLLINKCVEWSKRLFELCEDEYIKEHFYFVAVAFYKNEFRFNASKDNVKKITRSIKVLDDKKYFSNQFKTYYYATKAEYRLKHGRKQSFKYFSFVKYFISFNKFVFMSRVFLIRLFRL